jgi:hypothetical protein
MFKDLNYYEYVVANKLDELLNIDLNEYGNITKKIIPDDPNYSVSNDLTEPFCVELDDLTRLHYLLRKNKVITAIEIGSGKSTAVIADAIRKNKDDYAEQVKGRLRKNNAFELHTVETSKAWGDIVIKNLPESLNKIVKMHYVKCEMTMFNDRVCTVFNQFPNICPDFIYLDGPDQFSPVNDICGISTSHPDRMPMACDILRIEHFLLPGTMIVLDGRTANARFLQRNFQLDWDYTHYSEYDIHIFINKMDPLGPYNARELDFKEANSFL